YFKTGQMDPAWDRLQGARRIAPQASAPHNTLGHILAWRGDLAGAVRHYEALLSVKPDYPLTHSALGLVLAMQRDFERAEWHARRALELDPNLPGGHFNLGYVLELAGKVTAADVEYEREYGLNVVEGLADQHCRLARGF